MKIAISNISVLFILVVLYSVFITLFEFFIPLTSEMLKLIAFNDIVVAIVILVNMIYSFINSGNRLKFLKWAWIPILAILPVFGIFDDMAFVNSIFRFILLVSIFHEMRDPANAKFNPSVSFAMTGFIVLIVCCVLILHFEQAPDSNIITALDSVYWAVVTIATVGYGDMHPVTDGGKIVSMILIFTGVGIFASFIASFRNKK